jgi:hypothetical protein
MAKRSKTKPKPKPKPAAKRVARVKKAVPKRRGAKKSGVPDTVLDGLSAPIGNEYTTATHGEPPDQDKVMPKVKAAFATRATDAAVESPLAVIDTATHAALVAVNPIARPELPRTRPPRARTTPPATIAPRNVFLPDRVIVDVEGDTFPSTKLDEQGRDESILPATTFDAIRAKVSVGQRYLEATDNQNAFDAFLAGFELVPAPFENWNAAGWLLVAMGECAMRGGDHARAFQALRDAMHCPGTIGNPWVHLRLGQVRLELADERAADDLSRAYKGGGRSLFDGLDPKYLALVEKTL